MIHEPTHLGKVKFAQTAGILSVFCLLRPRLNINLNLGTRSRISSKLCTRWYINQPIWGRSNFPKLLGFRQYFAFYGLGWTPIWIWVSDLESPRNCAQDDIEITLFQILTIFGLVSCHNVPEHTISHSHSVGPQQHTRTITPTHPLTSAPPLVCLGEIFLFTMNQSYWNSGSVLLNCGQ